MISIKNTQRKLVSCPLKLRWLIALAIHTVFVIAANADAIPGVDSLVAKGVIFKTETDGTVSEASVGQKATVTADDYKLIGSIHTLKRLGIGSETAPLTDDVAKSLSGLDQLEKFSSNGAEMTDEGFKSFAGWKNLKIIGFDHWGWFAPGHIPQRITFGPGLAYLASCPNLEQVRFGGCRIDNRATTALAQIKSLQIIDLQHSLVTDEGIAALEALPKLRIVRLSSQFAPRITDASLPFLGAIKTLEELEIDQTWLTYDKGFSYLKELPALKKLILTKVVASAEDIAKLKADHPTVDIQWTPPDDTITSQTKDAFQKFWDQQAKAKP
jgi:hypothetical protein